MGKRPRLSRVIAPRCGKRIGRGEHDAYSGLARPYVSGEFDSAHPLHRNVAEYIIDARMIRHDRDGLRRVTRSLHVITDAPQKFSGARQDIRVIVNQGAPVRPTDLSGCPAQLEIRNLLLEGEGQ